MKRTGLRARLAPWLWFAPVLALLSAVTFYPLVSVIGLSLSRTRYYDVVGYVGLLNYIQVFTSEEFALRSFTSVVYVLASLAIVVPCGLFVAIVFNELGRLGSFLRMLTLIPWTLSVGVVGAVWLWLLNPTYGPIAYSAKAIGLDPGLLLGDPHLALFLMIVVSAWWSFPYVMVMMTAALQGIPADLLEAVQIDGGGVAAKVRYIVLPHILPALGSTALTLSILYLTVVTLVIIMTGGGPQGTTATWSFEVFRGTVQAVNIAPAAVYSVIILAANVLLGAFYMATTGKTAA